MSGRRIERFGLDRSVCEKLNRAGINTAKDFLDTNLLALMIQTNLDRSACVDIKNIISADIAPKPVSALQMRLERSEKLTALPTGCKDLDEQLRGGLMFGTVTELVGPPGIGKSNFCLSCCVHGMVAKTLNGDTEQLSGIIYVDTELKFDPGRLEEIMTRNYPDIFVGETAISMLSKVKVIRPLTCRELLDAVERMEDDVILGGVSLIVIDSVASLARKEALNEVDKEGYLVRQSALLKRLAEMCQCAILVTNQISVQQQDRRLDAIHVLEQEDEYSASLGAVWFESIATGHEEPHLPCRSAAISHRKRWHNHRRQCGRRPC